MKYVNVLITVNQHEEKYTAFNYCVCDDYFVVDFFLFVGFLGESIKEEIKVVFRSEKKVVVMATVSIRLNYSINTSSFACVSTRKHATTHVTTGKKNI